MQSKKSPETTVKVATGVVHKVPADLRKALVTTPDAPAIEPWVETLQAEVQGLQETDLFIGHSVGCQAILRFLEREAVTVPADHVILVAPWFSLQDLEDEEAEIAEEWLNTTIDFTKIKPKVKRITAFLSDNDPYVPFEENQKTLVEQLDAEVILVQGKGHFSEDDGMTQFPLLEEYL